jgi:hypothetical protein
LPPLSELFPPEIAMKQPPPPHSSDEPKRAPAGIDQEAPQDRAGRAPAPEPPPRQKGGAVDKGSAAAQVPEDDASLAPESGDKLGGGPGRH